MGKVQSRLIQCCQGLKYIMRRSRMGSVHNDQMVLISSSEQEYVEEDEKCAIEMSTTTTTSCPLDPQQVVHKIVQIDLNDLKSVEQYGIETADALNVLAFEPYDGYEIILDDPSGIKIWGNFYQDLEKHYVSRMRQFLPSHIFRYTFTIAGTIEQYERYISDLEKLKRIESSIDEYERVVGQPTCCVQYLRYKKFLMMDSRDFLYLKYSQRRGNTYIEVSKSIECPEFTPKTQTKSVRGNLMLSGNIITEHDGYLTFNAYSENNMMLKINPKMTKKVTANEIKKAKERMEQNL